MHQSAFSQKKSDSSLQYMCIKCRLEQHISGAMLQLWQAMISGTKDEARTAWKERCVGQ